MQNAMRFMPYKKSVAWMMIAGGQDREVKVDFERIQKLLERAHPAKDAKAGQKQPTGLEVTLVPSSLQGDSLLAQSGPAIYPQVVKFLTENVAVHELPWTSRRDRLP
jgi:hypothetical protein